jgi:hypothetical protein
MFHIFYSLVLNVFDQGVVEMDTDIQNRLLHVSECGCPSWVSRSWVPPLAIAGLSVRTGVGGYIGKVGGQQS